MRLRQRPRDSSVSLWRGRQGVSLAYRATVRGCCCAGHDHTGPNFHYSRLHRITCCRHRGRNYSGVRGFRSPLFLRVNWGAILSPLGHRSAGQGIRSRSRRGRGRRDCWGGLYPREVLSDRSAHHTYRHRDMCHTVTVYENTRARGHRACRNCGVLLRGDLG